MAKKKRRLAVVFALVLAFSAVLGLNLGMREVRAANAYTVTFQVVGINHDGRRILRFDHDRTRPHSPIINRIKKVYILENKSVAAYLRQLESVGEDVEEYASIWTYTRGQTEKRAPIFDYPDFPFRTTTRLTNYKDNLDKTER